MNCPKSSHEIHQTLSEALEQEGVEFKDIFVSRKMPDEYEQSDRKQTVTEIYRGPDGILVHWKREFYPGAENRKELPANGEGYVLVIR